MPAAVTAFVVALVAAVSCLALSACGGDGEKQTAASTPSTPAAPTTQTAGSTTTTPPTVEGLSEPATPSGRQVFLESGCLACHRFGDGGNRGPGPSLTRIGARLSRRQIEQVLRKPDPPMPPYGTLTRARFKALIDYLASQR